MAKAGAAAKEVKEGVTLRAPKKDAAPPPITVRRLEALASIGSPLYLIAQFFGYDHKEFKQLCFHERKDYRAALLRGQAQGRLVQLERIYKASAENPSVAMWWVQCHMGWQPRPELQDGMHHGKSIDPTADEQDDEGSFPTSGVLLLPADVSSSEEWEKQVNDYKQRVAAEQQRGDDAAADATTTAAAGSPAPQGEVGGPSG